ncbi:MAG: SPOR domain-containing protein [Thiotrichaceae bacterium]
MKGITKKLIQVLALVTVFGLASCSTTPVNDDTTGGDTGSGTGDTGGGTTDGGGGDAGGGSNVGDGFVVQLIASSSATKAESIKDEFVGEGYKAYVSPLGDLFRVQIGPYGTEADAQRVLDQMRRRYHRNTNVNNAVVKTVNGS